MWAKLVSPIVGQLLKRLLGVCLRELLVRLDSHLGLRNVVCRDKRGFQVSLGADVLAFVRGNEIEAHGNVRSETGAFSLQFLHGVLQQLAIQIKTNVYDMTALRCTEDISSAPDLKIAHRDAKSCPEA